MMDWTDSNCRVFHRLLTRRTRLYTEMVTTGALLHGDVARHLDFDRVEHPLALQLGGSEPAELAACVKLARRWGYDEVNLNCGCPSDRVQRGAFGACLMAEPRRVADGVRAMLDAADGLPITVKHRIGIDRIEDYGFVRDFVGTLADAGCSVFVVHARNAWLDGVSPKDNRDLPPLRYDFVYRLERDFGALTIVLNGGVASDDAIAEHLRHVDGVMLGRAAYHNPWLLARVDAELFGDAHPVPSRHEVLEAFLPYVERELGAGRRLCQISRHVLGLFQGCPGGRRFRRHIAEQGYRDGAGTEVLRQAAACVPRDVEPAAPRAAIGGFAPC